MGSGGSRPGAGRPTLGITRKVSLTLTEEEWKEIERSEMTVAAFLKKLMKNSPKYRTPSPKGSEAPDPVINYPKHYLEERWEIHLSNLKIEGEEIPPAEVIHNAKEAMFRVLYPKGSEDAVVRTHQQYECPFTGKRFGSMDKLIRSAIPTLIKWETAEKENQAVKATIKERQKAPRYLMDMR